jgi:hypothetical protein
VLKLTVVLVLAMAASAEVPSVCIDDRVGLNSFTRKAFETEVRQVFPADGIILTFGTCSSPAVSLIISVHPPARYARALGLAHRSGERVFPELRIYTKPVLRILGEQASAAQLGRALARVAAHELCHYLLQQIDHDEHGLMTASFGATQLGSEEATRLRPAKR